MRIPLATNIKTRTGNPDKDARLKNCYVESKGDPNNPETAVRKRPSAQGGVVVGTGIAQGGYGLVIFYGDTAYSITSNTGTTWNSGTSYNVGDMVSVNFVDYWAKVANTNSLPPNSNWNNSYVPAVPPVSGWTSGTVPFSPYIGNHPIAWNGSIYVFIGDNPSTGLAAPCTSTDGLIWTQQPDIAGLSYGVTGQYGINWNGTQFLAVGVAGVGLAYWATSTNGITWTVYNSALIDDFTDVAWNGTIYCATTKNSATLVYTSTNGITWTSHAVPNDPVGYKSITWNGSVFCIIGGVGGSNNIACTSPDGIAWTQRTLPYSTTWRYATSMGSLICATGGNGSRVSVSNDNGATWTGTIPAAQVQNIAASASLIVSVNPGASTSNYSTSTDGLTWVNHTLPATTVWDVISYGSGKGFIVIDNTTMCAFSITGI